MNNKLTNETRLEQIPVLFVRGTHYTVGYTIGRQFKNMIDHLLENWAYYNQVILPCYQTAKGKNIYEKSVNLCNNKFPQYMEELQGIADGSKNSFYKLFLLHIDTLLCPAEAEDDFFKKTGTGCTSVMSNHEETVLGHTEDALAEFLNNVYIVSAEIIGANGEKVEKFTTLSYAGHLPGYTMGYNEHGLVYSVNTIFLKNTFPEKTPRNFIARAILKASNFVEVVDILRDRGTGIADAFSLNVSFAKQDGSPVFHNVEIGPKVDIPESDISVLTLTHGDFHAHCNKYLRLKIPELQGMALDSSNHRHKTIGKHLKANTMERVKEILSDESDEKFPIFISGSKKPEVVKTVACGIFNISKKQWLIYMQPPNKSQPVAVLPMEF